MQSPNQKSWGSFRSCHSKSITICLLHLQDKGSITTRIRIWSDLRELYPSRVRSCLFMKLGSLNLLQWSLTKMLHQFNLKVLWPVRPLNLKTLIKTNQNRRCHHIKSGWIEIEADQDWVLRKKQDHSQLILWTKIPWFKIKSTTNSFRMNPIFWTNSRWWSLISPKPFSNTDGAKFSRFNFK